MGIGTSIRNSHSDECKNAILILITLNITSMVRKAFSALELFVMVIRFLVMPAKVDLQVK